MYVRHLHIQIKNFLYKLVVFPTKVSPRKLQLRLLKVGTKSLLKSLQKWPRDQIGSCKLPPSPNATMGSWKRQLDLLIHRPNKKALTLTHAFDFNNKDGRLTLVIRVKPKDV